MTTSTARILIALSLLFACTQSAALADSNKETAAAEVATVGKQAPDFTLPDTDGKKHTLKEYAGKYVVLEWVNFGCPFVKKHYDSKNMQALQATYTGKDVVWLSICSSASGKQGHFEGEELKTQVETHGSKATAYLTDAEGSVGRAYGAKTTPHMFVIDPKGILIYTGAIDDRPSTDKADIEGANNYVRAALDAAMAGKNVETPVTSSYGCSVKYKQ
jgi:peroxiredoxin